MQNENISESSSLNLSLVQEGSYIVVLSDGEKTIRKTIVVQ